MIPRPPTWLRLVGIAWGLALGLAAPPSGAFQGPSYPPPQPQGPYARMPVAPYGQAPQGQYGQMPPQGQYGQPMPWQYRPTGPDNARGIPPGYGGAPPPQAPAQSAPQGAAGMPGGLPPSQGGYPSGYRPAWPGGYAPGYAQSAPPRETPAPPLEWSLDETAPYVQQNLLLRLSLVGSEGILTAEPQIPASDDVLIQSLSGPTAGFRTGADGRREPATTFVMTLTPLRSGTMEVAVPEIHGTRTGSYGTERYRAVADRPIRLQVRPPMPSVRPWLPLKSLTLRATIDRPEQVQPGQPVTLALELAAEGGGAAQLPSLEDRIASPDFRVYREQTITDTRLSSDGRELEGKRTEYYTLVPQTGGNLHLPEIALSWWSLDADARETARLPIRTLEIEGGGGPLRWPSAIVAAGTGLGWVWMPFVAIVLVLAGYWAGVFYRTRGPGGGPGIRAKLQNGVRQTAYLVRRGTRSALRSLHPAPLAGRVRTAAPSLLPKSSRLLMCLRQANRSSTPEEWLARFAICARSWLPAEGQDSVPRMAERILALRPRADGARVARLLDQLDSALYGRQDIDFPRWKRDLMRQVGRFGGLLRLPRGQSRIRRARLPALNPRTL